MYERTRSPSSGYNSGYTNATAKMANDIGPRKTMFVLVVVVGCFAILWPKVFYPMLVGSANQQIKPSKIDKTTGCCDMFSEVDIDTIKIMSELCSSIIQQTGPKPLSDKEIVSRCKAELQQTCGIDISVVLQEQFRLGRSVKQILSEVRSLNGSLCLKYHYGVAPWSLGVPHRIAVNITSNVKQERPPHMRPDIIHPAFREKGSAIPKPSTAAKRPPKIVEGRPGPIPGMRPTLGGAGHVIPSQKTGSSMSVIMPIYTIGIVIFFSYTLMKLLFKKQPDGVGGSLYPPIEPDPRFRREVFESERCKFTPRLSRDPTGKIVVNAMSALLDEVNQEIEARRIANQAKSTPNHSLANGNLANGSVPKRQDQEQTSVKILGMETTASCEGGEKWNKSIEPVVPVLHVTEPQAPPQEIYLQGALPAQSQILVTESAVVTEPAPSDINTDPAVVLAGKMTLSVISLDSMHENEKSVNEIKPPSVEIQPAVDPLDVNGDGEDVEEELLDESKYTTASSATAAENEISEDEGTDNEALDDEDIEKISELEIEMNHILGTNGTANKDDIEDNIEEDIEQIEIDEEEVEIQIEAEDEGEEEIENIEMESGEEAEEIVTVEDEKVGRVIEIDLGIKDEEVKLEETPNKQQFQEDEKLKGEEEVEIDEEIQDEEWVKENVEEVQVDTEVQVLENVKENVEVKDEEIVQYKEEIKTIEKPQDDEKVKEKVEDLRKAVEKTQNDETVREIEIVDDEKVKDVMEVVEAIKDENKVKEDMKLKVEETVQYEDEIKTVDKPQDDERVEEEEEDVRKTIEKPQNDGGIKEIDIVEVEKVSRVIEIDEAINDEDEVKIKEETTDEEKYQEEEVELDEEIHDEEWVKENEEEVQLGTEVQVLEKVNEDVKVKDEQIEQYEKTIKTVEQPQSEERVKEEEKEGVRKSVEEPQNDERVEEQEEKELSEEKSEIDTEKIENTNEVHKEAETNKNEKVLERDEEWTREDEEAVVMDAKVQVDPKVEVAEVKVGENIQNEEEAKSIAKTEDKDEGKLEYKEQMKVEKKIEDEKKVEDNENEEEDEEVVVMDAKVQVDPKVEVAEVKVGETIQNEEEAKSIAKTEDKDEGKLEYREQMKVEKKIEDEKKVEDIEKLEDEEKPEIDKRTITEDKVNEHKSED